MNNHNFDQPDITDDEMLPEYDFTGGIRGKHYQVYRQWTNCDHSSNSRQETRFLGFLSCFDFGKEETGFL